MTLSPQLRPHASETIRQVSQVATWFPASFANRLEMLKQIESVEEEKRALTEEGDLERKDRVIQEKEEEISSLGEKIQAIDEQKKSRLSIVNPFK